MTCHPTSAYPLRSHLCPFAPLLPILSMCVHTFSRTSLALAAMQALPLCSHPCLCCQSSALRSTPVLAAPLLPIQYCRSITLRAARCQSPPFLYCHYWINTGTVLRMMVKNCSLLSPLGPRA